jgi:hypothetical protein
MNLIFLFLLNLLNHEVFCQNNNLKKIAIVGAHDENYDNIGKYAHLNKKKYAEKNGYDYFLYTERLDPFRPGYWYKVLAVKKHLKDYDWIFWLDSDALIMNFDIKLEDLIDERFEFITTRDTESPNYINSGQFLIKNCEWSLKFLDAWYSLEHVFISPGFDNGALNKLYRDFEYIRNCIKIIPLRMLSSFLVDNNFCSRKFPIDVNFQEGDFVVHMAGIKHHYKEVLMQKYYNITLLS